MVHQSPSYIPGPLLESLFFVSDHTHWIARGEDRYLNLYLVERSLVFQVKAQTLHCGATL